MTNFNCCSKYLELNLHTILASGCSSQVATAPHCLTVLPRFSLVKVWERPFPPVQRPQDFHICRSAGLLCWNSSASTKDGGLWTLVNWCSGAGGLVSDTCPCSPSSRLELSSTLPNKMLASSQTQLQKYSFSQVTKWHVTNSDATIFCLYKYELYLKIRAVKLQYNIIHISGQVKQIQPSTVPEGEVVQ